MITATVPLYLGIPQMAETNTPQLPMDVTERVSLYGKFVTGILACTFRRWVCYNPDNCNSAMEERVALFMCA
jgi:hypothetical protein